MSQSKQALKSRIRSVQSTKKITKAMQLVATSKLQKQKNMMEANREYASYLNNAVSQILADNENVECVYMKHVEDKNPYTIVITSDLGLCGGYNSNELRFLQEEVSKDTPIFVLGTKGNPWLKNRQYVVVNETTYSDGASYNDLAKIMGEALNKYVSGEITSISVVYTKFVNSVTFTPTKVQLLPVSKMEYKQEKSHIETLFEPSPSAILNDLIPMYVKSMFYSYYLETKTSEQASRRMAMENATDNATELIDVLTLKFNQARQAAITQEITEIVGGADAL